MSMAEPMDVDAIKSAQGSTEPKLLDDPTADRKIVPGVPTEEVPPLPSNSPAPLPVPLSETPDDLNPGLTIKSIYNSQVYEFCKSTWTFANIFDFLADQELLDPTKTKILIKGKQYRPDRDGHRLICNFNGCKGTVFGTTLTDKEKMKQGRYAAEARKSLYTRQELSNASLPLKTRERHELLTQVKYGEPGLGKPSAPKLPEYTFQEIRPLEWLPNSHLARDLLEKLRQDYGIQQAMHKHKLSVKLLTEMEPVSNTTVSHEGTARLQGLNRNAGEVIELRLRTDNHAGFRDYKTIRLTLCHELAHNRFGDHNRNFWDFCKLIEQDVKQGNTYHTLDGRRGVIGDISRVQVGDWELGIETNGVLTSSELRARAAEQRMKAEKAEKEKQEGDQSS